MAQEAWMYATPSTSTNYEGACFSPTPSPLGSNRPTPISLGSRSGSYAYSALPPPSSRSCFSATPSPFGSRHGSHTQPKLQQILEIAANPLW